jgi:hypothetical protein
MRYEPGVQESGVAGVAGERERAALERMKCDIVFRNKNLRFNFLHAWTPDFS